LPLVDNPQVKQRLQNLMQGLLFEGAPKASGQRLVYFVNFDKTVDPEKSTWGSCVLKAMLAPSVDSIARFQREIRVLNEIQSDSYPKHLYNSLFSEDPVTDDSLIPPWFITVEQRVGGSPLRSILLGPLSEDRVVKITLDLIGALEHLWKGTREYVHRDLSPENVLIDSNDKIRIIDLGLIREAGEIGYTQDANEFGPCNPKYCSPEQSINDKSNITYKSDFFVLGILIYEMLTGRHPFWTAEIKARDQMFNAIRNSTLNDFPSSLSVSAKMKEIIIKLTNKKPFERYRRPQDLKSDLNNIGCQNG
jgi:serine/threonine protein kinase